MSLAGNEPIAIGGARVGRVETRYAKKQSCENVITVNAFRPVIIETDMWAYNDAARGKLLGNYAPGELIAKWVRGIPMARAGTGADVPVLLTFLASEDAAHITGQTINVDGGLRMS
jgi:meso-butanediol dehydrogenase / (S,S)-butanediol dehydrogenase / diacetyl reductase